MIIIFFLLVIRLLSFVPRSPLILLLSFQILKFVSLLFQRSIPVSLPENPFPSGFDHML